MRVFEGAAEVRSAVGQRLGTSDWHEVTQEQIDGFADATGDHQWIHVDRERAAAGPFGTTVAHGFLTLSLIPRFTEQLFTVRGVRLALNYGCDRVRFPAPVPVGSRVRDTAELTEVVDSERGLRLTVRHTIEIEGGERPACVADTLVLVVP
jgi:acyl dehydratase